MQCGMIPRFPPLHCGWIYPHDEREANDASDRRDVAEEIEVEPVVKRRVDRVRRAHQEKCVAVRWGTHDRFGADIGAAPWAIFDDELLAEPPREPRSDEPRKNVGRAARSRRGDDTDRPRRIALRVSEPGHCRQRGSAHDQMQKISAGKFHFEPPSRFTSFDHLVGAGEERRRHLQTERLGGFEVDHKLEFHRLVDGQVGGFLALKNPPGIEPDLVIRVRRTSSLAHQPSRLHARARWKARWQSVARRQHDQLGVAAVEKRVGGNEQRIGTHSRKSGKGRIDVAMSLSILDVHLLPERAPLLAGRPPSSAAFGLAGFTSKPTVPPPGTISRSNSSRFAAIVLFSQVAPVTLAPGRLKLATKPNLTGSPPVTNTTGMAAVAALAASGDAVTPVATITATWRRTKSAASAGSRSY